MNWLYKSKHILSELQDSALEKRERKKEYENALLVNQIAIMGALVLLLQTHTNSHKAIRVCKSLSVLITRGNEILRYMNKELVYEEESR